jgi:hypothetical protein
VSRGEKDVTFEGVALDGTEPIDDVVIAFDDRTTKLAIDVTDAKGIRAEEFVVVVFPEDKAQRPTVHTSHPGLAGRIVRTAGPSQHGMVRLEGLFPGDYLAIAVDPDVVGEMAIDSAWYERFESAATKVSLEDGESRTLSLRVERLPVSR